VSSRRVQVLFVEVSLSLAVKFGRRLPFQLRLLLLVSKVGCPGERCLTGYVIDPAVSLGDSHRVKTDVDEDAASRAIKLDGILDQVEQNLFIKFPVSKHVFRNMADLRDLYHQILLGRLHFERFHEIQDRT
jgi:hypothetical protein